MILKDKENADRKTDFLFTLSHEIKNALNLINAMCSMAINNINDTERLLKYLNRIYNVTEHIAELMDKSLHVNVDKQSRPYIDEKTFKINDLKEELYQLLLPLAEDKNIDFQVIYERYQDKEVIGDYGRLLQVLINISTNSIKYTPEKGRIVISFEEETDYRTGTLYRIVCNDNGIGMDEDFIKHIFEPFARAEDNRVRKIKGTGLGMFIVKETVEDLGGNIHIDSMIDVGTTVTIMLYLKKNITKG